MALRLKKRKRNVSIPLQGEATIHLCIPLAQDIFKRHSTSIEALEGLGSKEGVDGKEVLGPKKKVSKKLAKVAISFVYELIEDSICGWDNIVDDETGKPLAFNLENKKQVFSVASLDPEFMKLANTALEGPLPNLTAGSTQSSNGIGENTSVSNASKTKQNL